MYCRELENFEQWRIRQQNNMEMEMETGII